MDAARGPDLPVGEQHSYAPLHLGWKTLGHARRFYTEIVNSVDDFVICGLAPEAAMRAVIERMMLRLRLLLNARRTRYLRVPEEPSGFLVGRNTKPRAGAGGTPAPSAARLGN